MAQDLHRYELEKLKLICEEAFLCKRIDVSTVAGTLAVAEQHCCHALKAACVESRKPEGLQKILLADRQESLNSQSL
jgi:speckle-type POZ protein